MSYQPEERYWTDYLRIALPIVGLLLMLALFWFWAAKIIGDDNGAAPTPKPPATTLVITATAPAQTPTTKPDVTAQSITPTTAAGEPTQSAAEPTDTSVADETPPGKGFVVGDAVVANTSANLRADPSTDGEVVATLSEGDELEVTEAATKKSGGYYWVGVKVTSGEFEGQEGYVADEFLDPSQ